MGRVHFPSYRTDFYGDVNCSETRVCIYKMIDWHAIATIKDLIAANVKFLKGELPETPYRAGPLEEDSVPLAKLLVLLNQMGYITTNGQASCDSVVFVDKTWMYLGVKFGNWYARTCQCPYIEGYLESDLAIPMIKYVNVNMPMITCYTWSNDGMAIIKNFPNLTKEKAFRKKEYEKSVPWKYPVSVPSYSSYSEIVEGTRFSPAINDILLSKYCCAFFTILEYDTPLSLETLIVSALAHVKKMVRH